MFYPLFHYKSHHQNETTQLTISHKWITYNMQVVYVGIYLGGNFLAGGLMNE